MTSSDYIDFKENLEKRIEEMASSENTITPYERLLEDYLEETGIILCEFCLECMNPDSAFYEKAELAKAFTNRIEKCRMKSVVGLRNPILPNRALAELSYFGDMQGLVRYFQDTILKPIWSNDQLPLETLTGMLKELKEKFASGFKENNCN